MRHPLNWLLKIHWATVIKAHIRVIYVDLFEEENESIADRELQQEVWRSEENAQKQLGCQIKWGKRKRHRLVLPRWSGGGELSV